MSAPHLGGSIPEGDANTYWPDIWGYLLLKYGVKSVVDIGCGHGHNLKWWLDQNIPGLGVEGDESALLNSVLPPEHLVRHDYTTGPYVLEHETDLAICTEFVEHVEQKYEDNWFATLKKCRLVLMCHALPGQGGHHHVNEQPAHYWIKRFDDYGFSELINETLLFQDTQYRKPGGWGRQTAMLFNNMFLL